MTGLTILGAAGKSPKAERPLDLIEAAFREGLRTANLIIASV